MAFDAHESLTGIVILRAVASRCDARRRSAGTQNAVRDQDPMDAEAADELSP